MGVLLLTQGNLARELLASAQEIVGGMAEFKALCLDWRAGSEEARVLVEAALDEVDPENQGCLILTDMFGGTPCNVATALRDTSRKVEVLAGVNLPMVVRLGCLEKLDLELGATAEWLREKGQSSICIAGIRDGRCTPVHGPCRQSDLAEECSQ